MQHPHPHPQPQPQRQDDAESQHDDHGWGTFGRRPALVLAGVAFVDAVERGILPGVLSDAQAELGFSDFEAGLLGSALIIAGVLIVLPAGRLADRTNRPRLIAAVLLSWGVVAALTATVRNYGQFLAARATLGFAEAIDNPASSSLIADYYPATARGRAYGAVRVAPLLGTAVGTGLGGLVASTLGWRWAFVLIGVPGSLLALAVLRLPNPQRGLQEGTNPIRAASNRSMREQVRSLWSTPSLRRIALGLGSVGVVIGIGFWSPSFFERHYAMSTSAAAGATSFYILGGGIIGTWLGARRADRVRQRDPARSPIDSQWAFLAAAGLWILAFSAVLPAGAAILLAAIGVGAAAFTVPGLFATLAEVVEPTDRGMAFSIAGFTNASVSALAPPVIGFLADRFADTTPADGSDVVSGNLSAAMLTVFPLVAVAGLLVGSAAKHVLVDRDKALGPIKG